MHYPPSFFDTPIDRRGTDCEKWDAMSRRHGKRMLPMWVADMDFPCPTAVSDALQKRALHPVYGYTEQTDAQVDALLAFAQRRHGLTLQASEQYTLPCVITGLCAAVRALSKPGDGIIIQPPVYGPFFRTIASNGRVVLENNLLRDASGRYTMDFEGLEALCKQGASAMLLCSPHNPVGRCWTKAELTQLWDILSKYNVALISDEIHWDFVYGKGAFTSVLALPAAQNEHARICMLTSVSKSFNLAGLLQATLLIRNPELMQLLTAELQQSGATQGNLFSLAATEAAYREGDDWLDGLLAYVTVSKEILAKELAARLPQVIMSPMEATYLAWLDCRAFGLSTEELLRRTHEQGLALTEGTFFGKEAGEGFLRVNLACPHSQLEEAINRLEKALSPKA